MFGKPLAKSGFQYQSSYLACPEEKCRGMGIYCGSCTGYFFHLAEGRRPSCLLCVQEFPPPDTHTKHLMHTDAVHSSCRIPSVKKKVFPLGRYAWWLLPDLDLILWTRSCNFPTLLHLAFQGKPRPGTAIFLRTKGTNSTQRCNRKLIQIFFTYKSLTRSMWWIQK